MILYIFIVLLTLVAIWADNLWLSVALVSLDIILIIAGNMALKQEKEEKRKRDDENPIAWISHRGWEKNMQTGEYERIDPFIVYKDNRQKRKDV